MSTTVKLRLVKRGDGEQEIPVEDPEVLRYFGSVVAAMDRGLDVLRDGGRRRQFLSLVRDRAIACKDSMDYGPEESS